MSEYTPNTESVCERWMHDRYELDGVRTIESQAEFNRWLETVRAEAKSEALEEAASAYPVMLRDMVSRPSVAAWLRNRADKCKEGK
ncbi:hypothetical protein [Glutamicibacter sp. TV12E]|uniref:hypothetical protein n=1 Tax=Glutamicibacter sp. TV12E TaxID=3446362 RepID=UPI0040332065